MSTPTEPLRNDFHELTDHTEILLFPEPDNPIHDKPIKALFSGGYFWCEESPAEEGPDYFYGDVARYCAGFVVVEEAA